MGQRSPEQVEDHENQDRHGSYTALVGQRVLTRNMPVYRSFRYLFYFALFFFRLYVYFCLLAFYVSEFCFEADCMQTIRSVLIISEGILFCLVSVLIPFHSFRKQRILGVLW